MYRNCRNLISFHCPGRGIPILDSWGYTLTGLYTPMDIADKETLTRRLLDFEKLSNLVDENLLGGVNGWGTSE